MIDFTNLTYHFDLPLMQVLQGSDSLFLDRFIYVLTGAPTWIPLYVSILYLVIRNNDTMRKITLILSFAVFAVVFADYVVDVMVKPVFMRYRPCQDPVLKYTIDVVNNYRGGTYGFFSAHAANTMAVAVFFCLIVKSRLLSVALLLWSLVNCYTRIYLGAHYPSDVIIGIIWGCFVAFLSYTAYRYIESRTGMEANCISDQYTDTGYSCRDVHIVITVMLLTLLYAMFRSIFEL